MNTNANRMETTRLSSGSAGSATTTSSTTAPTGLKNRHTLTARNLANGINYFGRSDNLRRAMGGKTHWAFTDSSSTSSGYHSANSIALNNAMNGSDGAVNASPVVDCGSPAVKTTPVTANQDVDMDSSLSGVFSAKADSAKRQIPFTIKSQENIGDQSASKFVSAEASPVTGSLKKVSDLRKQFDRPEFGRVESAVDDTHINFADSRRKFQRLCLEEKNTNIQTPITAKQFRGIYNAPTDDKRESMVGGHAEFPIPRPRRLGFPVPAPRNLRRMSGKQRGTSGKKQRFNRGQLVSLIQSVSSTSKPVAVGTDDFEKNVMSHNRPFCEAPKSSLLDEVNRSFAKNFTPTLQAAVVNNQESEKEEELIPIQPIIHVFTNEERQNRIIELNRHMAILRQQAKQVSRGIKKCRMQKFDVALDAELFRIAAVKEVEIRATKQEIARFEDDRTLLVHLPRSTLTLSEMAVSLTGLGPFRENRYEFVMLVVRHKDFVHSTQICCVNRLLRNGSTWLKWDTSIKIPNVSPDFVVSIDVCLLTYDFPANKSKAAKKSLFQLLSGREVRLPDQFEIIGHMKVCKTDLQKGYHTLKNTGYRIQNEIFFYASIDLDATWSGNVSIYREGSWELYYGRLLNARMKFWTSREHVDVKEHALCLNMCDITEPVHPFADDRIGFQFDFAVSLKDREDKEVRLMLSCSSSKDRNAVINALNESYEHTKTWNGVRLTHFV